MVTFRALLPSGLLAVSSFMGLAAAAQNTADIQKTFESKYSLTKPTADRSDIVTAGDVIVLQKDGLLMCATTSGTPTTNDYKNGRITQSILNKRFGGFSGYLGAAGNSSATRTFVSGEKFWITAIATKEDGVIFSLMSDPISDTRYYSTLKIQFPKGQQPPAADLAKLADQIFKIQPADNASGGDAKGGSAPAPAAAPAAPPPPPMEAIAPPPPPADAAPVAPPTIKLGLTKDQVTAMFGQPTKVVKLATKEIDIYPDMKVTFVHDKVSDIQ